MSSITSLSLSVLSSKGYQTFRSFDGERLWMAICDELSFFFIIRTVSNANKGQPVLRLTNIPNKASRIIAVDASTNCVWLIPIEDIEGLKAVRLGKRWDNYKTEVMFMDYDL